ncbi:MAG TPA: hypothetical protein VHX64_10550 [Caulobacteraceae bacterium]|nr:hypothetical protein [Caulobacteraceae bacterium]
MIGRIVGTLVGAAMALLGCGMLKPALFVKYFDFSKLTLGPFDEYKTLVCWMIVAFGAVVALASLQRPTGAPRRKRAAPVTFAPAETAPAHSPMTLSVMDPEPDAIAAHQADDEEDHEEEEHDHHGHADAHAHEPAH